MLLVVRSGKNGLTASSVGSLVWALVAFTAVMSLAFDRTRQLGLGLLIGFGALFVVGAGTCSAVLVGTSS